MGVHITRPTQRNTTQRKRTEVRSGGARDEELAPVGVRAAVGHGQEARTVVLVDGQVFVGKGRPIDAEFPRACVQSSVEPCMF